MITYQTGNILHDQADAIINTVNTVGVMGKGLALQFKKAFPACYFKAYKKACDEQSLVVGQVLSFELNSTNAPFYVINFPTKAHWKGKSKLEYIEQGLISLKTEVMRLGVKSVAIPALGSGLGGLPWQDVERLIQQSLADVPDVEWRIYPPQAAPSAQAMPNLTKRPSMTIGRAAVLGLIERYVSTGFGYRLSLLEVQKLVYFLTAAGEPLNKVVFKKHHYGPYADVLRHVLDKMEGHFITGYADGLNKPETPIALKEEAAQEAFRYLEQHQETKQRFDKVAQLIQGFESQNGMELLSTVHWVVTQELPNLEPTDEELVRCVHRWNPRKAKMKPAHILAAWNRLKQEQWLVCKAPTA
ncbi:type II toxin-antitoxin system antitoxin DNA ADP-ribosyl glycohydrolase DarG [Motilimonas eburnea]|uniref:type II toxin-antitoxin system antitoxin DNA ADP-ribosyl glycohydrolase DarG n=1 Tax=Motilimonas eburnea TaxID=1737488 RepID=UPI001E621264|nr:macro domain-containing protein [Motilimonas eburnea]MCE2572664.1 macro domain-containing protein [Motilimonas eburnea]